MQKQISELLLSKKLLLKNFKTLDTKEFSKKRSYEIYFGVDLDGFFTLVFVRNAKSRFISKDANELLNLDKIVQEKLDKIVKKRVLFYNSQMCSKSKKILEESEFIFYDFV